METRLPLQAPPGEAAPTTQPLPFTFALSNWPLLPLPFPLPNRCHNLSAAVTSACLRPVAVAAALAPACVYLWPQLCYGPSGGPEGGDSPSVHDLRLPLSLGPAPASPMLHGGPAPLFPSITLFCSVATQSPFASLSEHSIGVLTVSWSWSWRGICVVEINGDWLTHWVRRQLAANCLLPPTRKIVRWTAEGRVGLT